jgi:hypothetical protein
VALKSTAVPGSIVAFQIFREVFAYLDASLAHSTFVRLIDLERLAVSCSAHDIEKIREC